MIYILQRKGFLFVCVYIYIYIIIIINLKDHQMTEIVKYMTKPRNLMWEIILSQRPLVPLITHMMDLESLSKIQLPNNYVFLKSNKRTKGMFQDFLSINSTVGTGYGSKFRLKFLDWDSNQAQLSWNSIEPQLNLD